MIAPQILIMSAVLAVLVLSFAAAVLWVRRVARAAQLEQLAREEAVRAAAEHRRKHGPRYLRLVYGKAEAPANMLVEGSVDGVHFAPIEPGALDPPDFHKRFKLYEGPALMRPEVELRSPLADGTITLLGRACDSCGAPIVGDDKLWCARCRALDDAQDGSLE